MIEQATVDAYGESEQMTGWFTMIEENLAVPFQTTELGVSVIVKRVDLNASEQIVAICTRGRDRQAIPILDLPMPKPPPTGMEWIEAYRQWQFAESGSATEISGWRAASDARGSLPLPRSGVRRSSR
jgi:hypothetical protein